MEKMFVSSYVPIKSPNKNLIEFVLDTEPGMDDEKPIFIDSDKTTNYYSVSSIRRVARQFGAGIIRSYDFKKGDVAAIFSPNSIEYPMVVFGIFYAGGTVTLINPFCRDREVASQLRDSRAKLIYTTAELFDTALTACEIAGMSSSQIVVSGAEGHDLLDLPTITDKGAHAPGSCSNDLEASLEPEDVAFLCYSSGTTGSSKGVRLTHCNLVANLLQWDAGERFLDSTSSLISVLPFSHIYALNVLVMNPLRRRMSNYVLPRFHAEKFFELVALHRITATFIVPPIVRALLSPTAAGYDLSSLTFVCSGAAPLSMELTQELSARYSLPVSQGYGLTETSPVLAYSRFNDQEYTGSVGRLLPNIEMRVIDGTGASQGPNGLGELQVRGPNVMLGYLNNAEANANAFTEDGFFKTGDLGYVSEDGYVFVVDRIKELIKYKGFQVPPVELESLLLTHPAILDCAVVGRQCDIEVTELPTAYCVLERTALESIQSVLPIGWTDLDETESAVLERLKHNLAKDIIEFIAARVANYKKLRGGVVFTDTIPRVPAGKVLRRVLKEHTGHHFLL